MFDKKYTNTVKKHNEYKTESLSESLYCGLKDMFHILPMVLLVCIIAFFFLQFFAPKFEGSTVNLKIEIF